MKMVLVTGAAGGIGSATVESFRNQGYAVISHDVVDGPNVDISGDLLNDDVLTALVALCRSRDVDTVVAAHGLAGSGDLRSISDDRVRTTMRVNTVSVLRVYDAIAGHLIENDGSFIVVSSQAGLDGEAQNAIYSASKFALVGWTKELARGVAPRMRVICPGMTETPLLVRGLQGMAADANIPYEEYLGRRLDNLPSGRLGRPSEIGRAIVWLAQLRTRGAVVAAVTGGETFE